MRKIGVLLRNNTISNEIIDIFSDVIIIGIVIDYSNNINLEFNKLKSLVCDLSGVILPGGSDVFDIDLLFIEYLYKINIPVLGICLGMQEIASVFNGKLEIVDNHKSNDNYVHKIYIKNNSKLNSIIFTNCIYVNSRHLYKVNNTSLEVSAISEDSVIECIESVKNDFFIGVQWHPESLTDIYSNRLFNAFKSACYDYDVNKAYRK